MSRRSRFVVDSLLTRSLWGRVGLSIAFLLFGTEARGQLMRDSSTAWLVSAGSEGERYLRMLTVAGMAPPMPWSVRPFSVAAQTLLAPADSAQPWRRNLAARRRGLMWVRPIQPEIQGIFNTTFPYGMNDGPVWAGRGLTSVASAGVQGEIGPLEFTIAPQVFRAENASFALAPTGIAGPGAYADPAFGMVIDLPQRFGDGAYQRVDPGQSSVQLHLWRFSIGASTANETWGPAVESPFLFGNNAAGFGHLFAGTDGPLRIGPLSLSGRLIAGRLEQSAYSVVTANQRRYLTGAIVVLGVQQLTGLEIGFGRVFENLWPDSGVSIGSILNPLLKNPLRAQTRGEGNAPDNQLASLFARWSAPAARLEIYGELGREDNSYDLRDLIVEPDHDLSYMFGFQRVWAIHDGALLALRGETLNTSLSHLSSVRYESPPYIHDPVRQGYTQLGQVLGAPGAFGGGATSLALDWYRDGGRRTVTWRRWNREPRPQLGAPKDVVHDFSVDWLLFRTRVDLVPGVTLSYELNRQSGGDAVNLRGALAGRVHW